MLTSLPIQIWPPREVFLGASILFAPAVSLQKCSCPTLHLQSAPSSFCLIWNEVLTTTRSCQAFLQQLLAPPNPLVCSWQTHICPPVKADLATYSRGNPSSAGISSAETGFSKYVLGIVHEVVRYFTSPVAPMTTGTPGRGGISMLSFASGDAGKLFRS